jgi:hypothetical protein
MSDIRSLYERDQALWSAKHDFLVQQRDTSRKDLIDAQKKFELTIEQMKKKGVHDLDKKSSN